MASSPPPQYSSARRLLRDRDATLVLLRQMIETCQQNCALAGTANPWTFRACSVEIDALRDAAYIPRDRYRGSAIGGFFIDPYAADLVIAVLREIESVWIHTLDRDASLGDVDTHGVHASQATHVHNTYNEAACMSVSKALEDLNDAIQAKPARRAYSHWFAQIRRIACA